MSKGLVRRLEPQGGSSPGLLAVLRQTKETVGKRTEKSVAWAGRKARTQSAKGRNKCVRRQVILGKSWRRKEAVRTKGCKPRETITPVHPRNRQVGRQPAFSHLSQSHSLVKVCVPKFD